MESEDFIQVCEKIRHKVGLANVGDKLDKVESLRKINCRLAQSSMLSFHANEGTRVSYGWPGPAWSLLNEAGRFVLH